MSLANPLHLPARYDHVGSFLRPDYLLKARAQRARGEIDAAQLRDVEDRAIAEIVAFQRDCGLQAITDGEFRRTYFHIDFLEQLGGVKTDIPVTIKRPDGTEELAPPVIKVVDKVREFFGKEEFFKNDDFFKEDEASFFNNFSEEQFFFFDEKAFFKLDEEKYFGKEQEFFR